MHFGYGVVTYASCTLFASATRPSILVVSWVVQGPCVGQVYQAVSLWKKKESILERAGPPLPVIMKQPSLVFFPHLCLCLFNVAFLPKLKEGFQNSFWVDIGEDKTCWKFQVLQMMP